MQNSESSTSPTVKRSDQDGDPLSAASQTGILLQGADGIVLSCDPIAERLLGYSARQLVGATAFHPAWQTIHPNGSTFSPHDYPAIVALRSRRPCHGVVMGFYRPSGELVWLCLNATPLFQPDVEVPYAVVTALNAVAKPTTPLPADAASSDRGLAADCQTAPQLQQALQTLETLVASAPLPIVVIEPDGTTRRWNPAAETMFGWREAEVLGQPLPIVPDERLEECRLVREAVVSGAIFAGIETCRCRRDRSAVVVSISAAPLADEQGDVYAIVLMFQDITERQQAETALRQSEERFQLMTEATNDVMWDVNVLTQEMWWSDRIRLLFGYPPDELGADMSGWAERVHPEDLARVQTSYAACLSSDASFWSDEYRFRRATGTYASVFDRARILRDPEGNPVRVVGAMADISSRKRAEQILRESEDRFRQMTDAAPMLVWMSGTDKLCHYFNQSWLRFTGRTIEQELGNGWAAGVHPDDFQRCLETYTSAFDARRPFEMDYRLRRFDGEYRWILDVGIPRFTSAGEFLGYMGSCFDIHDRKQSETEREHLLQREQVLRQQAETAELKLQQVLASLREDFVLLDHEWQIAYLNAQAAETMRLAREEALGKTIWQLFPDLVGTEFYDRLDRVMRDRVPTQFEYYYPTWDRWFENRVYPTPDGIVNLSADITVRKRAELSARFLNELEARLRQLSDADAMLWETMSRVGEYLKVDRCLWHDVDPVRGLLIIEQDWRQDNLPSTVGVHPLSNFSVPDLLAQFQAGQTAVVSDVTTHPAIASLAENYIAFGTRAFVVVPCLYEGSWVASLVVNASTVRDWRSDEVALLQEIVARLWVLTEHARAVQELRQSETELRQKNAILDVVNESVPTPIFVKDRQGRLIYANPATLRVLGKTAEEVIGYRDCDLYPCSEDADKVMENDRRIMELGQMEVVEESPDGVRTFLGMKVPYRNEAGDVIGLIGISNDITDRVQLERDRERILQQEQAAREAAENANRIKDEFLAVLSHELRTPLNPILGWAKLLQQGKLDAARTKTALRIIERNAQLQAQLINDLLDISRILRGKLSLEQAPVDLKLVVAAALETVRLAAEAKLLRVQTVLSPAIGLVTGDAGRLQQVVWNLLSNAVKFTPSGGQVTVRLTPIGTDAQLEVSDTGKGIQPTFLPHVFEHFRQEDGATTRQFGGLGLGLSIARQLIELHGGTITASSLGEGQGATFTVRLPLAPALEPQPAPEPSPAEDHSLSGARILVVDDEPDSRDIVAFVLEQAGAIVTIADSGLEALQAIEQAVPDLIVSDIGMPEMDGYMLLRRIRNQQVGSQIPAIALTAYAGEFDRQQALQAGFQQHLAKPIEPAELVASLVRLRERKGGNVG